MKKTVLLLIILLLIINCDNLIDSKSKKKFKHPSEYTWIVDTLDVDIVTTRFRASDILYISKDEIYIFGENSHFYDVYWQYDGEKWEDKIAVCDSRDIIAVTKISDKIYGVGTTERYLPENINYQGSVVKFTNKNCKQIFYAHADNHSGSRFWDIWGDSENNIWVGGWYGLLYHFDGKNWLDYSFPDSVWVTNFSGKNSNKLYACGYAFRGQGMFNGYFMKWDGKKWKMENEFHDKEINRDNYPFGWKDICLGDEYIYSCGNGVYRKKITENNWEKIDFYYQVFKYEDISGSSDNNIYAVGFAGAIVYWDGEQWHYIADLCTKYNFIPYAVYTKAWTDGDQVYIVGYDYNNLKRTYVIHGK